MYVSKIGAVLIIKANPIVSQEKKKNESISTGREKQQYLNHWTQK